MGVGRGWLGWFLLSSFPPLSGNPGGMASRSRYAGSASDFRFLPPHFGLASRGRHVPAPPTVGMPAPPSSFPPLSGNPGGKASRGRHARYSLPSSFPPLSGNPGRRGVPRPACWLRPSSLSLSGNPGRCHGKDAGFPPKTAGMTTGPVWPWAARVVPRRHSCKACPWVCQGTGIQAVDMLWEQPVL